MMSVGWCLVLHVTCEVGAKKVRCLTVFPRQATLWTAATTYAAARQHCQGQHQATYQHTCAWFLTPVTAPFSLQSTDGGGTVSAYLKGVDCSCLAGARSARYPSICRYSSRVWSAKWFKPNCTTTSPIQPKPCQRQARYSMHAWFASLKIVASDA